MSVASSLPLAPEKLYYVSLLEGVKPDSPLVCKCKNKRGERVNHPAGACNDLKPNRDEGKIVSEQAFSWSRLCEGVANPDPVPSNLVDKGNLEALAPGRYSDRRRKTDVIGRQLVWIDSDEVEDIQKVLAWVKAQRLAAAVHTTFSSPNADGSLRIRVIVPLSREVSAEEWDFRVKAWMRSMPGAVTDNNALDVTRFLYAPVRVEGYQHWIVDGGELNVDSLPETTVPRARTPHTESVSTIVWADLAPELHGAARTVGEAWAKDLPATGERHATAGTLASCLYKKGVAPEQIPAFVEIAASVAGFGNLSNKRAWAETTVRNARDGKAVDGWPTLQEKCPTVADAIDLCFESSLLRWSERNFVPPRNDVTVMDAASATAAIAQRLDDLRREPAREFTRGDHAELSEELIGCNENPLTTTEGAIWEYRPETGAWASHKVESELRKKILAFAGRKKKTQRGSNEVSINHSDVEGIIKSVKTRTFEEDFFVSGQAGISCTNGMVSMNGLVPHSPDNRSRSAYPFAFDPEAKAPLFQQFLLDLFRDDDDQQDKIACLQEFFGGALFGLSTRFDKCIIAKGDGSNGKSTLLEIVRDLFPAHQVQAIPPEKWGHAFTLAELVGCLLNIVADISATSLMDSPRFKDVVAGDLVQAERKHQPSFNFRPIAGHFMALNPNLETKDQTSGFWRRIIAIEFKRNFEADATKDTTIAEKILATERPGVLAWLVEGARRLIAQDAYTVPASHTDALARWKVSSDNVRQFAEDFVDSSAEEETKTDFGAMKVYRTYKAWAQDNGQKPVTSKNFKGRIERVAGVDWKKGESGNIYRFRLAKGRMLVELPHV